MAEQIKSSGVKGTLDKGFDKVSGKVSGIAQDVVGTLQENRPLLYAGVGLLVLAAGVGIWALVRQFRHDESSDILYGQEY